MNKTTSNLDLALSASVLNIKQSTKVLVYTCLNCKLLAASKKNALSFLGCDWNNSSEGFCVLYLYNFLTI